MVQATQLCREWLAALQREAAPSRDHAGLAMVAVVSALLGMSSMMMGVGPTETRTAAPSSVHGAALAALEFGPYDEVPLEVAEVAADPVDSAGADTPFGDVEAEPEPVAVDFALLGTAVTDRPELDTAMVRLSGRTTSRLVHRGDVVEGYRVVEIQRRRVTLRGPRGNRWEMQVSFSGSASSAVADAGPLSEPPPSADASDTLLRPRVVRRLESRGWMPDVLDPLVGSDGALLGYELRAGRGSIAARLGLHSGDVLIGWNGRPARELGNPDDMFETLVRDERLCLEIQRGGDIRERCFRAP